MTKVHVLPHTHWDREWYFTQQDSEVLSAYNFTKVIETLENEDAYSCYHLDGQSAIVEDYLRVLPHMRERMAKLVSDKRLFIGPWYTQTDSFNVAGESIIRNLKYGMHIADQLGHSMKVGYLPDTFGHNAQMPTLFNGAGIDNTIFWRGIDFDSQVTHSNFNWTSPGGDTIVACNLVHGYGAAKNIVAEPDHLDKKIFPMIEKIKQLSGLDEVLIPSGGDQVNIDPELPKTLAAATERTEQDDVYVISSMESYIDYLRTRQDGFENYQGEFKTPRYARIHKTIGSVRYDIKKLNFDIEQFLLKKLEVVVAIAKAQGITVHTELVDIAWKKILESHAHDSMGGCNSDATNTDIMHRLKQAQELVHGLYNLIVKEIASQVCTDSDILVFNNRIKPFSGLVDVVVFSKHRCVAIKDDDSTLNSEVVSCEELDGGMVIEVTKDGEKEVPVPPYYRITLKVQALDLPALGYKTFSVVAAQSSKQAQAVNASTIENDNYKLALNNGQLTLTDKNTGRTIDNLLHFENVADDGDSYDFSPLKNDKPLLSDSFELLDCVHGEYLQTLRVRSTIAVPSSLDQRLAGEQDARTEQIVTLTLQQGSHNLKVDIEIDNSVCDHRVRALVNTDVTTQTSIATQPFALMERPVANNPDTSHGEWRKNYRECPVDIETTEGAVAIAEPGKAVVINGAGLKEFQILEGQHANSPSNTIALTLFKSVGVLGKNNLHWRPGRASGINNTVVHTPDAQLQQRLQFSFALSLTEEASHKTIRTLEAEYLTTPFSYQYQSLNSFENRLERFQVRFDKRDITSQFSLLSVKEDLEISSISHSLNDSNTLQLRLYNAGFEPVEIDLAQFSQFENVAIVNYCEQVQEQAEAVVRPNNTLDISLKVKGGK